MRRIFDYRWQAHLDGEPRPTVADIVSDLGYSQGSVQENLEELYNLRFQKAAERIENPGRMRGISRNIARIKTVFRERSKA